MKKRLHLFIATAILLMSSPLFAQNLQWQPTNGPWGGPITSIVHCGSFLFALSNERVFRSGDSGGHWAQLPITQGDTSMGNMSSVNNILFACGVNGSFRSTDFGNSWISYTGPSGLVFGNDTALISSDDDYLWRSYDSGANWSQIVGYPPIYCMLGNRFVRLIDAVETAGSILISTDNGSSWQAFDTTSNLTNAQTIYPVGNTLLAGRSDRLGVEFCRAQNSECSNFLNRMEHFMAVPMWRGCFGRRIQVQHGFQHKRVSTMTIFVSLQALLEILLSVPAAGYFFPEIMEISGKKPIEGLPDPYSAFKPLVGHCMP